MTLLRWLWANPIIYAACCLQVGMAVVCLAVMPFDHRQILGLNPWIKPLKFDISITVLLLTSAAFLEGLERWEGARTWAGSSLAIALSIESILITLQAARGVRSHLNISTPFDARVSMLMGLMAVVATLAAAAILGLTFVATPRWPPAVLWGVRLGLLMFLAGSFEGTLMFKHGGHTIGAEDGGQGMPLLNWSLKHGDLRVAHFFALHALQAFPIFGYLSFRTSGNADVQVAVVFFFSALYTAGVWYLFRLAMQGRPLMLAA
jgi:hypothetical protein